MKKNTLPRVDAMHLPQGVSFDLLPSALARWNSALAAKEGDEKEDDSTISIYDTIGFDPWTGAGVTAKRVAAVLRNLKGRNVTVNINSPGGDLFEGIAIYNLLRDHDGEVTTRVVGLAASAASVIAMAGEEILIARAGFMMIHNVWVFAMGNRNDLREAADQLETFDDALAAVYAARSGMEKKDVAKLMDKETWFSGDQAIERGFADGLLPADEIEEKDKEDAPAASLRAYEAQLARRGMPRTERRALINGFKELFGKPGAAEPQHQGTQDAALKATQDAGVVDVKRTVDSFLESIKT